MSTPFEMISFAHALPKRYSTVDSATGPTPSISQRSPVSSSPRLRASTSTWRMISARGVAGALPTEGRAGKSGLQPVPLLSLPSLLSLPLLSLPLLSLPALLLLPGTAAVPAGVLAVSGELASALLAPRASAAAAGLHSATRASAMYASCASRRPSRRASSNTLRDIASSVFLTSAPSTGGSSPRIDTAPSAVVPK